MSPFAGQDLNSALLAQQQNRKAVTPSSTFDNPYNYDPILTKIQAISAASLANAKTEAEQLRRQAAIDTGDQSIAQSLNLDPNTISATAQNPESIMAQLNREFDQRSKDLQDSYSSQNLMYSGAYTDALSALAKGRASAQASAGDQLRTLLSGIDTNLLAATETDRQQALQAASDAALARHYAEMSGMTPGVAGTTDGSGNLADFKYDAVVPSGYSLEQIYAQAKGYAPAGQEPGHIMNQGQVIVQNGKPGVMIKYWDTSSGNAVGNTIWIPLPDQAPPPPVYGADNPAPVGDPNYSVADQLANLNKTYDPLAGLDPNYHTPTLQEQLASQPSAWSYLQ